MTEANTSNICGEETEVYSRVVGYCRPLQNWHKGKLEEFRLRKTFKISAINFENNTKKEEK